MNRNITALILIILAIGIYFTVTKDQITTANGTKKINDQFIAANDSANTLIDLRDKVLNEFKNVDPSDIARLNKMIPSTVDNIRLIIDLSKLGKDNNLALKNVKATASKASATAPVAPANSKSTTIATPTLDTVTVSFGVTTTYQQFIAFLKILESNLRIMDITHLSLTSSDTGNYDFSIELKTYWLRQ